MKNSKVKKKIEIPIGILRKKEKKKEGEEDKTKTNPGNFAASVPAVESPSGIQVASDNRVENNTRIETKKKKMNDDLVFPLALTVCAYTSSGSSIFSGGCAFR